MVVSDTPPAAAVHPFAENIVKDPRRVEPPITGLNDRPLQRLMDEFGALEADHLPPRKTQLSHAVLVTSAEPGYGKSHLLGRYLRTLDRRASKIYIKPFQNPSLCWQSILLRTIQELNFPDRSDVEFGQPGEPTQLDALAIGIFAHLIAAGLDSGEIGHEKSSGQRDTFAPTPSTRLDSPTRRTRGPTGCASISTNCCQSSRDSSTGMG